MKLVIFGLGYSAEYFVRTRRANEATTATVTTREKAAALANENLETLVFSPEERDTRIATRLAEAEAVLVSIPPDQAGDPVLAAFADAIAGARNLRSIVYLSTIGVYGDHFGAWIDETARCKPGNERSLWRLDSENAWRALGEQTGISVHVLRLAGIASAGNWPGWRGPTGQGHSEEKGLPLEWDAKTGKNILWKAKLGSRAYGGPTIANGRIFCGTNNENPRNKRDRGKPTDDHPEGPAIDKGVVMCFEEKNGSFLWQAIHDKLGSGMVNDWVHEGICSTPSVDEGRVYYVSNRCTVVCAELNGYSKGAKAEPKGPKNTDKTDVDIVWEFDMMKELNVFPHNMAACSPLIVGDMIFVVTAATWASTGSGADTQPRRLK